ncbi:MAG: EscU/YscU/HrcU family type III secretion system export apparatus switch protein [Thermodesulfobacteriota bacterium]
MTQDKRKGAVALKYERGKDDAPKVVASGRGQIADRIQAAAAAADVPLRQDPDLLEVLAQVPVGDEIPEDLYQAVAEILAFVYRLNGEGPKV